MESDFLISNIIMSWDDGLKEYDIETYMKKFPNRHSVIDIFPYVISDSNKYDNVSVFYQKFLDGDIDKKEYFKYEERFINFIKLVWLYNDIDICYNFYLNRRFKKGFSRYKVLPKLKIGSDTLLKVDDFRVIQESLLFSLREAGFLWMYLRDWDMIMMVHGFNIVTIVKEAETLNYIHPLLLQNSLYCRT